MCYVYILKCCDNTFYTGWTNCLKKRLETHKKGKGAKYTRGRLPVELVYFEKFEDKISAQRREYEIKKMTKKEKYKLVCQSKNENFSSIS
ncbi:MULTISPECIES: GIY-YIG nuclease family protein [Tissierellales]|jgi:putative endonuclease|uniref:GIY-YIG nuclease family protein n=1 Tax=Acidilutibacter cellobiosedens TaxID=2507161 RepID=A0A410QBF9_9FIRM|nr:MULTISPECIES: GIY-YIG nuclease family protein [Tissierellales]MBE6082190.1 GIY-YIG nuclease family protein [Tissierellaceae bacterium]QAT61290.1 GIY-YIG nuclease family protein [Acidilutibacter cellobiosedens]SCL97180.1 GIY-YIG nuclease superfamily protein [Sporanaerobacter sp. PP17-6a]